MPLLKPAFLRAHPIQSGMIWAVGFAAMFLLVMWVTGILRQTLIPLVIVCSAVGGLAWGYSMKAYHDRLESKR